MPIIIMAFYYDNSESQFIVALMNVYLEFLLINLPLYLNAGHNEANITPCLLIETYEFVSTPWTES